MNLLNILATGWTLRSWGPHLNQLDQIKLETLKLSTWISVTSWQDQRKWLGSIDNIGRDCHTVTWRKSRSWRPETQLLIRPISCKCVLYILCIQWNVASRMFKLLSFVKSGFRVLFSNYIEQKEFMTRNRLRVAWNAFWHSNPISTCSSTKVVQKKWGGRLRVSR